MNVNILTKERGSRKKKEGRDVIIKICRGIGWRMGGWVWVTDLFPCMKITGVEREMERNSPLIKLS